MTFERALDGVAPRGAVRPRGGPARPDARRAPRRSPTPPASPSPAPSTRSCTTWELHHFREWGLEAWSGKKPSASERARARRAPSAGIAEQLAAAPRGFTHRDYQSRNLMVKDGELVVIDFQDALQGPRQYDLVALLRDSYVELDRAVRGGDARPLRSTPTAGTPGATLDRRAFTPLLRPAHRAAQAEGRGPLRVHPPGEGQPGLPASRSRPRCATSARRWSASRTTRTSSRSVRSRSRYVPELR